MIKKLTLLATAIAVLAFAVPAMASAAPSLTMPAKTLVPANVMSGNPNSNITGTSVNAKTTTSLGTLTCAKVTLNGTVTENTGSSVKGVGTGAGTTTTCKIEGESINITDVTLAEIKSTVSGAGSASFSFQADLPVVGTCTYTGTNAPFTYVSGSSVITFNKATLTASPSACGTAALDGEFSFETTENGGGAIILD
jgi:hypothetical protein